MFRIVILVASVVVAAMARSEPVVYQVAGQSYEGYVVKKGPKSPVVLIVHDWDGLTDYERKRADMLGGLGYSVFAIDLFGKGVRPAEEKDKKLKTGELYGDRSKMRALLNGALAAAQKAGLDMSNAVAAGYCFGGAAVLELARSGAQLKGFVSFHGGLATPEDQSYKATKGKLLILHGSADAAITLQEFATLATELESTGVPHEMITYSGAPHAFTVFGSERYRKDADEKSWARFLNFLKEIQG